MILIGTTINSLCRSAFFAVISPVGYKPLRLTAARLAQLEERRSTEREVVSSNPGRTIKPRSLGGDVKPLALSSSSLYFSWKGT